MLKDVEEAETRRKGANDAHEAPLHFGTMNQYGDKRSDRLETIDRLLNEGVPGLQMRHFTNYNVVRKGSKEPAGRHDNCGWVDSVQPICDADLSTRRFCADYSVSNGCISPGYAKQ